MYTYSKSTCYTEINLYIFMYVLSCIVVHGIWNPWSEWTECSTTCENGTRSRNRTCDGPFFGGDECAGSAIDIEDCFLIWCPGNNDIIFLMYS